MLVEKYRCPYCGFIADSEINICRHVSVHHKIPLPKKKEEEFWMHLHTERVQVEDNEKSLDELKLIMRDKIKSARFITHSGEDFISVPEMAESMDKYKEALAAVQDVIRQLESNLFMLEHE